MIQSIPIRTEDDVLHTLRLIRFLLKDMPFTEAEQQMILVSASELTRNILVHAGAKGCFRCVQCQCGIRLEASDNGPGIDASILNGERPAHPHGLGLGLSGVRRLMDEVSIETSERGTTVIAEKWCKRPVASRPGHYDRTLGLLGPNRSRHRT